MSEAWDGVAFSIAQAVAELDRMLDCDDDWRALGQLEAREAAGERLEAVAGADMKAQLQARLSASPAYQIRERLRDAQRLMLPVTEQQLQGPSATAIRGPVSPPDDLTRLRGVTPVLAAQLADMGVRSYSAIAAWSADDVRRMSTALGLGKRISRENWIEQAALLMARAPMRAADAAPTVELAAVPVAIIEAPTNGERAIPVTAARDVPSTRQSVVPPEGSALAPTSLPPAGRDILVLEDALAGMDPPLVVPLISTSPVEAEAPLPDAISLSLAWPEPIPQSANVPEPVVETSSDLLPAREDDILGEDAHPVESEPAPLVAERPALPSAAIFAAPLSAVVPFIAPEILAGRTAAAALRETSAPHLLQKSSTGHTGADGAHGEQGARASAGDARSRPGTVTPNAGRDDTWAKKPVSPLSRAAPPRPAKPREILAPRPPEPAPLPRSAWTASENREDARPLDMDKAHVEIVRKAPAERPLPRPEPKSRLPRRPGAEAPATPRMVLKDVEPAEVVIVPRGAPPPATTKAEEATGARGRLDVSRIIAGWRGS